MTDREKYVYDFFISKGWAPHQAAGILGNLVNETGRRLDPTIIHDGGTGLGLAGWRDPEPGKGRRTQLYNFAASKGKPATDFHTQLEFLQHELETSEAGAASKLRASATPEQAAEAMLSYERPWGWKADDPTGSSGYRNRLNDARRTFVAYGGGNPNFTATIAPDETSPQFAPAGTPAAQVEINAAQQGIAEASRDPTLYQQFQASWDETLTRRIFEETPNFQPDDKYAPTVDELNLRRQGLPEKYWSELIGVSAAHSDYLTAQAKRQYENEKTLADAGWSGTAVDILVNMGDPVSLGIGIASGGLGAGVAGAAKLGRIGQRVAGAAAGAAGNVATEGLLDEYGRVTEASDYAYSALLGGLFGGAFGPMASRAQDLAAESTANILQLHTALSRGTPPGASLGDLAGSVSPASLSAAANLDAHIPLSTSDFMRLADQDVPTTAISTGRYDMAGVVGSSPNPGARAMGQALMTDTVGLRDKVTGLHVVNPRAADQDAALHRQRYNTRVLQVANPSFDEWAERQGLNWWQKAGTGSRARFSEEVYDYIAETDPGRRAEFDPAIRRTGDEIKASYRDQLLDNKDPLRLQGGGGRALPGLENVMPDEFYQPRIYSLTKLDGLMRRYGETRVIQLFERAILSRNPDFDEDLVFAIAKGMVVNHRKRGFNMMERGGMLRNGVEPDLLRAHLTDDLGLSSEQVERAIGIVTRETPGVPRAKRKFDLDETVEMPGAFHEDGRPVTFRDVLVKDALTLHQAYTQTMQGWAAFGRMRIADAGGNALVDGIRSTNEFERALAAIRARGTEIGGSPDRIRARLDKDERYLRAAFDRIRGVPHGWSDSDWAKTLELIRNYNYARLGANFGVAQLMDMGSIISTAGVRAMLNQMPEFRRIVRDGASVRASDLGREIEHVFGLGGDNLRGLTQAIRDEVIAERYNFEGASGLDRALASSRKGADFVIRASGLHYLTGMQQLWTGKLLAQKFSDMASRAVRGGAFDPSNLDRGTLNRMLFLGLDEPMLGRVLSQFAEHRSTRPGMLGGRLTHMNLDNWTDLEARAAFETALFRQSRKAVQEGGDAGTQAILANNPLFRTVMQLRNFMLTAWHNQFLHNVNMRDWSSFAFFTGTMLSAAMVYAAQTRIQALTESDPDKFLDDRLNPRNFGAAVFQRAGWSSILPSIIDTSIGMLGMDPMFNYRTSGQPSSMWFGNPSVGLYNDAVAASQALMRPFFDGREASQQEMRDLLRVFPMQNWMPLQGVYSTMIRDRPERTPRSRQGYSPGTLLGLDE